MNDGTQSYGVSRRRVVQGALWTAPAIAFATAIPAAAASTDPGTMAFASGTTLLRQTPGQGLVTYTFDGLVLQHLDGLSIADLRITITSNQTMNTTVTGLSPGWVLASSTGTVFVFTYSGSIASGGVTLPLDVVISRQGQGNVAVFVVTASGDTNGGNNNATATHPAPIPPPA